MTLGLHRFILHGLDKPGVFTTVSLFVALQLYGKHAVFHAQDIGVAPGGQFLLTHIVHRLERQFPVTCIGKHRRIAVSACGGIVCAYCAIGDFTVMGLARFGKSDPDPLEIQAALIPDPDLDFRFSATLAVLISVSLSGRANEHVKASNVTTGKIANRAAKRWNTRPPSALHPTRIISMTRVLTTDLLTFNPDQDALHPAGLTSGATELAVAKHRCVTDSLEMRHVEHVVAAGLRARQFNCEAFQPPRLSPGTHELACINERNIADPLQMRHVPHTQAGHSGVQLQLESLQAARLTPCAGEFILAEHTVADALQMHQDPHRGSTAAVECPAAVDIVLSQSTALSAVGGEHDRTGN